MMYAGPGRRPKGYYTEHTAHGNVVHPIMGPEQRRPTDSTEPTLWSSVKRTSHRAPRDPWNAPLRRARADMRHHAGERSAAAYAELGNADVRMMDAPPRDYRNRGEWDWFRHLSPQEQARLRRSWFRPAHHPGYGASGPDQVAERYRRHYGGDTSGGVGSDEVIGRWVHTTRVADAGQAMSRGRLHNAAAYGNMSPKQVVGDHPLDAERVFDSDRDRARAYMREESDYEAELAEYREERDRSAEAAYRPPPPWVDEDF